MTAHGVPDGVPLDALLAHREWVRALARRLVLDENDADDVEQETWRMAVERPPRHAGSIRGWLSRVATNAARTSGRRRTRRSAHEAGAVRRGEVPSPEVLVAAAELHTRLARAVLDLDEPYRSTVLYRFHEGLEASEIAARLGVPVETVRTRVKRAIERLRERMDVERGDDRAAWSLLLLGGGGEKGTGPRPPVLSISGTATAAAAGGGIAMAAGTKLIAAAVIVVAGAAWWLAARDVAAPAPVASEPTARVAAPRPAVAAKEPRVRGTPTAEETKPSVETAAPAPAGDVVHGRVVDDETGGPVAKVRVSLVWGSARQPGKEPSGASADDGTFRVAGAVEGRFGDLLLESDGYAETIVGVPWRERGSGLAKFEAGDVRIFRGRRVTGRVLTADGRSAVTGARICLSKVAGSSGAMWFSQAKEFGTSGDDGTFALDRVPPAPYGPYTLLAAAPGGIGWATLPAAAGKADTTGVEVRLRPPGAVTVTVRDEAGAPRGGARVFASPRFEPLGPPRTWPADHSPWLPADSAFAAAFGATTDATGVARFGLLPVGDEGASYDFIVHAGVAAWQDGVAVVPGEEKAVTIVVKAPNLAAMVAGVRVVDPDGHPVEGAALTVVSGPADWKATTDAAGVAVLAREKGEESKGVAGWFAVAKEGFAKQNVGVRFVRDDGSPLPTVTLVRPAPIDGRIVDQDGKPVAACYVDLLGKGAPPSQTTGADGRFSFPDATAGDWTLRHFPPPPYDEWEYDERQRLVRGGDRDVVVVTRRLPVGRATLTATLVDAETGAAVSAQEAMLIPAVQGVEPIRSPDAKTEIGAGTITLPRMRPGRYRLWVRVPNRGAAVATVEVAEGQTEVAVRVRVGETGTLRGRVELADTGLALPSMVIPSRTEDWTAPQWATTQNDGMIGAGRVRPDGTFTFTKVLPGRYRVWIDSAGFLGEGVADVPAGGEGTAVVTFTRGGQLSFRLLGPSPSDTIRYDVAQDAGPWRCVMNLGREKGKTPSFAAPLRPGAYRWRVTFPADAFVSARTAAETAEGEVTVVAGETVVVDVPVAAKR